MARKPFAIFGGLGAVVIHSLLVMLLVLAGDVGLGAQSRQVQQTTMTSISNVDWTTMRFKSDISLDTQAAQITLPAGRNAAVMRIKSTLPMLIKDPLLSLNIDARHKIGDYVINNTLTLEEITDIIDAGKMSPCVFRDGSSVMSATNTINMNNIGERLIHQQHPYLPAEPIRTVPSRVYSGIIIDARGTLPVQGEYVSDNVSPCFFPRVWNESMELLYERDMMDNAAAKRDGIVRYGNSEDIGEYSDRVGYDPLYIRALKIYGRNRTDTIISDDDALKILTIKANRDLLRGGKVVILIDKDKLSHDVAVPQKDESYYVAYRTARRYVYQDEADSIDVDDTMNGITFSADFKFRADSPDLLPSEAPRIRAIADSLFEILSDGSYTVLVEGYAADVGKPKGQLDLSIERTRTVMNALIAEGLPAKLFSYRGYGGTDKFGDNSTDEGRRKNRRVDITARPKATYIQRDWQQTGE